MSEFYAAGSAHEGFDGTIRASALNGLKPSRLYRIRIEPGRHFFQNDETQHMNDRRLSQDTWIVKILGKRMHDFIAELYPICRSITGEGVRETLRMIQKRIPLEIHEVPSGTKVFDWTVPLEWNCRMPTLRIRQERVWSISRPTIFTS